MAVEIPVVVDIEGAFEEAARKVPKALSPLKSAIDGLNEDLSVFREMLNEVPVGSKDFQMIAKEIQNISQAMDIANAEFKKYSSNDGSIRQMSNELAFLNDQWEKMSKKDKFTATGEMSEDAKRLYNNYKNITSELERQGKTLAQLAADEKRTADEARRRAAEEERARERIEALRNKGAKNRQYEAAILNATNKTMRTLQEQERILSNRLSQAIVGSSKYEKLRQQLEAVRREIKEINGEPLRDMAAGADAANSKLKNLLVNAVRLYALHSATRFVKNVREVTSEFELQRVALGSIIQDTERAEQLFQQIKAAAIQSPFEIKDLVSYTKQLSAYQIETEKLFETTMKLADVSAGLGVDMGRLILAYGQVRAASVLRGQELRQFTEAGIPLVEKLAEKFRDLGREGTTTADVFQLISERAVPFRMIDEIFDDMTNAGGMFYKMQEKQAKTLAGQWANLKDALSIMYDEIGRTDAVHGAMESLIGSARQLFLNWRKWADAIKIAGTSLLVYVGYQKALAASTAILVKIEAMATAAESTREKGMRRLVTSIIGKTAAEKISTKATHLASAATFKAAAATTTLEKAFWRLTMALLNNPFGIIAIAVTGLVALFTTLGRKTRDIEKDIESLKSSIVSLENTTGPVRKMIDEYEELSSKQTLSVKESKRLKDISLELAKAFPKATEKIDEQTGAFKLNILKMRAYNEEAEKAIRKGTEAQISVDEKEIKRNQSKIEKLNKEINTGWGRDRAVTLLSPLKIPLSESQIAEKNSQVAELTQKNIELAASIQEARDALNGVKKEGEGAVENVTKWQQKLIEYNSRLTKDKTAIQVLSPDQIKNMSNLDEALDEIAKAYTKQQERAEFLTKAIEGKNEEEAKELKIALALALARKDLAKEILDYYHAFSLTQKKTKTSGSYQQDPFISQMQNRIKFMQDFKKGYDDLRKYLGPEGALGKISETMLGRGQSLNLDAAQQQRAATDLSSWYEEMIKLVETKLRAKGVSGVRTSDLLGFDTTKRGKDVQDLQKLLQSLWDAKTDFDTSEMKRKVDEALKKLSEEIKRSETARNFFENILGLTGDEDLAANMAISIYGDPGDDLSKRLKDSIQGAMRSENIGEDNPIWGELMDAAENLDFRDVMSKISDLPEGVQNAVKEASGAIEKHNVDIANSYAKLLLAFDEIEQKRVDIENNADNKIKTLREGLALEIKGINENVNIADKNAAIEAATARANAAEEGVNRERELDLFRLKREYRLFFESVGTMSLDAARKVAKAERDMVTAQFEAGEISLSKFRREMERIDEQLKKYEDDKNPFVTYLTKGLDGLFEKLKQEGQNLNAFAGNLKDDEGNFSLPEGLEKTVNTLGKIFGGGLFGVSGRKNVFEQMKDQLGENADDWEKTLNNAAEKMSQMGSNFAQGIGWADFWVSFAGNGIKAFDALAQKSKNTEGDVKKGWNRFAKAIFATGAGPIPVLGLFVNKKLFDMDDAWERLTGLNEKAMSGFEKFKQGDIIGAIIDNIEGWSEVLGTNTKKIDRQIKDQSELLEDLDYQYSRIEKSIQKAFGSDYITNYNKQLENLYAQQEAYLKQAELERSKGKKSDEEKIKEYEKQARNTGDQIQDMQSQLSEFFSGTDLTSAAKDFANAWIEAYKEYGSVTTAMKEKFQDMVQSMVENSLAARVMQDFLRPIFDEIDRLSQEGSELSTTDIAAIAEMANAVIPNINDAMTTLMNTLAAGGYNVRQQAGQFTGIKRNIANASEESINGLTQATNVNNFYMQSIAQSVAQILAIMSGGTTEQPNAGTQALFNNELALQYMSALPNIDLNMAELLRCVKSVISDKNFETNASVIAVRA